MTEPRSKGELVPVGGGDPIPLVKTPLVIGRRESCEICLRFPNISGRHAELTLHDGIWYLRDLGSTNGTKVNGQPIQKKLLRPGDEINIASRRFRIQYTLPPGRMFVAEDEDLSQPLLDKAGLSRPPRSASRPHGPIEAEWEEDEPQAP